MFVLRRGASSSIAVHTTRYICMHIGTLEPPGKRQATPPPAPLVGFPSNPTHLECGVHRGTGVPRGVFQLRLSQRRPAGRRPVDRLPPPEDVSLCKHLPEHLFRAKGRPSGYHIYASHVRFPIKQINHPGGRMRVQLHDFGFFGKNEEQ